MQVTYALPKFTPRHSAPSLPSPTFGRIYGVTGPWPESLSSPNLSSVNPQSKPKERISVPYPVGKVDPRVETAYRNMVTLAEAEHLPITDLIVTRSGGPYQGEHNVTRELRIIFTEGDALLFGPQRNEMIRLIDEAEKIQADIEANHRQLRKLSDQVNTLGFSVNKYVGMIFGGEGYQANRQLESQYNACMDKKLQLEKKRKEITREYLNKVPVLLKRVKESMSGYISIDTLEKKLETNSFDVRTGGDELALDPAAVWYHGN
jgi:hypothetical protein